MQAGLRRRRAGGARQAAADSDEEDAPQGNHEDNDAGDDSKAVSRRDAYEARRAARDAEREAQEAAQEEEIRKAAEERARREQEEAEKWMHTFTVEASGEEALSKEQGEALLNRMVDYIKHRKMVALEELAAEFSIRTADAISKVQALEAEERITGVMDDRGKFIYISRQEMEDLAGFIKKQGRVAIAQLAMKSSEFIDLEPREIVEAGLLGAALIEEAEP